MRPKFSTFRKILGDWCLLIDGKEPSTNKRFNKAVNQDAGHMDWWSRSGEIHDGDTSRNLAYLVAYLEAFGPRLPMRGLAAHEGWVYPDRAVMRSLIAAGYLAVEDGSFIPTAAGRAQIAPWLLQEGDVFRRVVRAETHC
jgi:hypothetical protein